MSPLYAGHRLLLVPSTVEDAFPGVIIEAGLRGLANLGADRAGIREAIGDGGVIIPGHTGTEAWVAAIRAAPDPLLGKRARERSLLFTRPRLSEFKAARVIPS